MPIATERLVNLALMLASSREPVSTERIRAEVFGYPERQSDAAFERMFERDKQHLRGFGLAIESTPDGLNRLDASATFVTDVALSHEEITVLRTVGIALVGDPTFPFAEDLRCALSKILPWSGASAPAVARMTDEGAATRTADVARIAQAATKRQRIRVEYTNALGITRSRTIEPFGLFVREGEWYVVGRDPDIDALRTFAVSRISEVSITPTGSSMPEFDRPEHFDIRTYVGLPFQYGNDVPFTATLMFEPEIVWRAPLLTHGIGTVRTCDTAQGEPAEEREPALWDVAVRDRAGLMRWVVANGPGIRILQPADLAEELAEALDVVRDSHAV